MSIIINPATTISSDDDETVNKNRFITRLAIVASMSGLLFGYDTGVVSGAMIFMRVEMDLSPFEVEVLVSSTVLAAAFSSFFGHHLIDEWGRKRTLMVASTILIIGSIIMGATVPVGHNGLYMMVVGRVVVGIAIGLASEAGPLYISECAPPPLRGKLTTFFNIAVVGGQVFAAVLCGALSYLPTSYNWRVMLAFGAVPALGQWIGFLSLPLSPTWLVLQGKPEEAELVLRQIRMSPEVPHNLEQDDPENKTHDHHDDDDDDDPVKKELQEIIDEYEESKKHQHVSLLRLWKSYPSIRRAMILGCSLWAVSQLAGINTIMYYGASIVRRAGLDGDRSFDIWITVPLYTMQLIGIFICYSIIDRWGRRPTLFFSMTFVFISLLIIGIGFAVDNGTLTVSGMMLYLLSVGTGLSTMPYTMNAEIFPTEYRGLCVAQSTAVFWGTNFIVSCTFLRMANAIGTSSVFFIYAGIVFFSEIYFYVTVPETSGLSLHEIQAIFEKDTTRAESMPLSGSDSDDSTKGIETITKSYGTQSIKDASPEERALPKLV